MARNIDLLPIPTLPALMVPPRRVSWFKRAVAPPVLKNGPAQLIGQNDPRRRAYFFLLLLSERMYLTRDSISSSFSLSLKPFVIVSFLPFLMASRSSESFLEACHLGSVKFGVLMAEKPLPSGPWHMEHLVLKLSPALSGGAACKPRADINTPAPARINVKQMRNISFIYFSPLV